MPLQFNRTLRLPPNEYIRAQEAKTGICIHHTIGGTAESTFNWWNENHEMVGVAYLIDRDGTVFEVFEPEAWAWQFGLQWEYDKKLRFEKRFIGIEIASEGGLLERNGQLYKFDRVSPAYVKPRNEAFDFGQDYRGYRYFDKYEPAQIDSLVELINHLTRQFPIPKQTPDRSFDYYGEALRLFEGIIGHTMVRKDKSDPAPDRTMWQRLQRDCGIQFLSLNGDGAAMSMTDAQIDDLFRSNMLEVDKMSVPAGSMVKCLLIELGKDGRDTFIRLHDAEPNGHSVDYSFVEGKQSLVQSFARHFGFKSATDSRLEVRGG